MLGLPGPRPPPAGILLALPFLPLLLLLPAAPAPHRASYKPVIVVHGLFDSSYSFRHLLDYINEVWPGTPGCGRALEASRWLGRKRAELKAAPLGLPGSSGAGAGLGRGVGDGPPVLQGTGGIGAARVAWRASQVVPSCSIAPSHRHTLAPW